MRYLKEFLVAFVISFGTMFLLFSDGSPFRTNFVWGVTVNPTPTFANDLTVSDQLFQYAKKLGINTVRLSYPGPQVDGQDYLAEVLKIAHKKGLKTILGLSPKDYFAPNSFKNGFDMGEKVARQYSKLVDYYQIGNEPAASAIKATWSGFTPDAYEEDKYLPVANWLKGASAGVGQADPRAPRIITGHWKQIAFFKKLIDDGVEFEIIGWDWFNEDKSIFNLEEGGEMVDLVQKLAELGKQVWIMEAGLNGEEYSDKQRGEYLSAFAKIARLDKRISGFFPFTLTDEGHLLDSPNKSNGLISLTRDLYDKTLTLGKPKEVYYQLQQVIRGKVFK